MSPLPLSVYLQLKFRAVQVKPVQDSELSKKQQVEQMFDHISPRYDFLNRLLSFGIDRNWRKKVRKAVAAKGHRHILDVATGTADLAVELCKIPASQTVGIDISAGMLSVGEQKIRGLNLHNRIVLQQADSEKLPFPDGNFDAVTVAFGVRNFENLQNGITEMLRVIKPGGHLFVLEFSKPKNRFFSALYWFYFKAILPRLGRLLSKNSSAYSYLPRSVDAFPEGENFKRVLQDCGGLNVIIKPLTFGISSLYQCEKA
jgi:demethylmenaquinone methyltransferase/2-methoxy-6-polyprenyl-1,4-benzoquinol methylase